MAAQTRQISKEEIEKKKLEEALKVLDELKGSVKNIRRLTKEERDKLAEEYLKDPDTSKMLRKYGLDKV